MSWLTRLLTKFRPNRQPHVWGEWRDGDLCSGGMRWMQCRCGAEITYFEYAIKESPDPKWCPFPNRV